MGIESGDNLHKAARVEGAAFKSSEHTSFGEGASLSAFDLHKQTDSIKAFNEQFDPKSFSADQLQAMLTQNAEAIKQTMAFAASKAMELGKVQDKNNASNILGDIQLT